MKKVFLILALCVLVAPCLLALCGDSVLLALCACAYGVVLYKTGLFVGLCERIKNELQGRK